MTHLRRYFFLGFLLGAALTALGIAVGAIKMQQRARTCIETVLDVMTRNDTEELAEFRDRCNWIIAPLLETADSMEVVP